VGIRKWAKAVMSRVLALTMRTMELSSFPRERGREGKERGKRGNRNILIPLREIKRVPRA
jgi:hypothetical protein